ncbi:hypothetical protein T492DRAFT_259464 [Pavlovales sp. CCMP2436]|nr:hypothetical protein T492DRAFT_259464 [Pavlovales sp. CCMP2436]
MSSPLPEYLLSILVVMCRLFYQKTPLRPVLYRTGLQRFSSVSGVQYPEPSVHSLVSTAHCAHPSVCRPVPAAQCPQPSVRCHERTVIQALVSTGGPHTS